MKCKFAIDLHTMEINCKFSSVNLHYFALVAFSNLHEEKFATHLRMNLLRCKNERKCGRHLSIMQMIAELVTR